MQRLLPATEQTAWPGAHTPGTLLLRASWTTGAWAPSSRGLFGMSLQLTGPDPKEISKWSGLLARCLSEEGRVRAARGHPSVLAERRRHRRSAAAMACGWRGLQFAGAQDSITYLKLSMRGRPHTRVQAGMLSNVYGMLDCVAHVCAGAGWPCSMRNVGEDPKINLARTQAHVCRRGAKDRRRRDEPEP